MKQSSLLLVSLDYIMEPSIRLYSDRIAHFGNPSAQFEELDTIYGLEAFLCCSQLNMQFLRELLLHAITTKTPITVCTNEFSTTSFLKSRNTHYADLTFVGWDPALGFSHRDYQDLELNQITPMNWMMHVIETTQPHKIQSVLCKTSPDVGPWLSNTEITISKDYPNIFTDYTQVVINSCEWLVPAQFSDPLLELVKEEQLYAGYTPTKFSDL